jgi:hypothetical protein
MRRFYQPGGLRSIARSQKMAYPCSRLAEMMPLQVKSKGGKQRGDGNGKGLFILAYIGLGKRRKSAPFSLICVK